MPHRRLIQLLAALSALLFASTPAIAAKPIRDVHYSYDIMGRQLTAKFDSAGGNDGITNSYNGFGELLTSQVRMGTFTKTLTSQYDGAGRRTELTHPDNQAFTYAHDALGRLSGVYEGAGTGTPLTTFAYGNNGLVSARTEGAGNSSVGYGWDDAGRLTSQSDVLASVRSGSKAGTRVSLLSGLAPKLDGSRIRRQSVRRRSSVIADDQAKICSRLSTLVPSFHCRSSTYSDGWIVPTHDV